LKKFITVFLLIAVSSLLFCGCGSLESGHCKAIAETISDFDSPVLICDNLEQQVRLQFREKLPIGKTSTEYSISVKIRDVTNITEKELKISVPEYDLNSPDPVKFNTEYIKTCKAALNSALGDTSGDFTYETVRFVVTRSDDNSYTAVMNSGDAQRIITTFKSLSDTKYDELLANSVDRRKVILASFKYNMLRDLFGVIDDNYIDAVKITDISPKDGNAFSVSIVYPDPVQLFPILADKYVESFSDDLYEPLVIEGFTGNSDDYADALSQVTDSKTATFVVRPTSDSFSWEQYYSEIDLSNLDSVAYTAFCAVDESTDQHYAAEFASARNQAGEDAQTRINNNNLVQSISQSQGIVFGKSNSSSGQSVTVSTSDSSGSYYVVFSQNGTDKLGVYINGGKSYTVYLPAGTYSISYAFGTKWYGRSTKFGPDGKYVDSSSTLTVQSGYTYSFKL